MHICSLCLNMYEYAFITFHSPNGIDKINILILIQVYLLNVYVMTYMYVC